MSKLDDYRHAQHVEAILRSKLDGADNRTFDVVRDSDLADQHPRGVGIHIYVVPVVADLVVAEVRAMFPSILARALNTAKENTVAARRAATEEAQQLLHDECES